MTAFRNYLAVIGMPVENWYDNCTVVVDDYDVPADDYDAPADEHDDAYTDDRGW